MQAVEEEQFTVEERFVGGARVVQLERVRSNLWKQDRQRFLRLYRVRLADGRTLFGCAQCPDPLDTVGSWADIIQHRREVHAYRGKGGGAARGTIVPAQAVPDDFPADPYQEGTVEPVAEPPVADEAPEDEPIDDCAVAGEIVERGLVAEGTLSVPASLAHMTFGEVLRLAHRMSQLGDLLEELRLDNAELKRASRAQTAEIAELTHERDQILAQLAAQAATIRKYHEGFAQMGLSFNTEGAS